MKTPSTQARFTTACSATSMRRRGRDPLIADTMNPGLAWRKREDRTLARERYSEEFRRDAVKLYRSTPGATVVGIAGDRGVMDTTLSAWLKAAGVPVRHTSRVHERGSRPARGQQRGEERSGPQLGSLDRQVAGSGRHQLLAGAVALGGAGG